MSTKRKYRTKRLRNKRSLIWDVIITITFLLIVAVAVSWLNARNPQAFVGKAWVVDGDTIVIDDENLRLSGIDAPEMSQICTRKNIPWECGVESKSALIKMLRGREVRCNSGGLDRYDRWLVVCDVDGNDINAALVKNGWAIDYGGYAREEAIARRAKAGIWQGVFENPQEWRRANRGDASNLPSRNTGLWRKLSMWWSRLLR